jgi:hypothetical protein
MKPPFRIVANIYVHVRNHLNCFARRIVVSKDARASIIPSHKWWAMAGLLLLLMVPPACGTSGVVIVTHDFIVIATDSALQHLNSEGKTSGFSTGCKILRDGNIFYFPAGEYGNQSLGFDLFGIVKNAITKAGKIKNIYPAVEASVLKYLPAIVQYNKTRNTKLYKRWLQGIPVIEIAFASFEDDAPVAAIVEFRIDAKGSIVQPGEYTLISSPGQIQIAGLGWNYEIAATTEPSSWRRYFVSNPIKASQELIQLEIDASIREKRYDVSRPISILRISKDSSEFVRGHAGECAANH